MATRKTNVRATLEERFWAKVDTSGSCWVWTANCIKDKNGNRRYGLIGAGRRGEGMLYAHRVSWELHNGPIPKGLKVLHRCDNPQCVNPKHLFLGTQLDNVMDMYRKGRNGRTGPIPGSGAKVHLSSSEIAQLRLDAATHTNRQLAEKYGIGVGSARNIALGLSCYLL